MIMFLGLGVWWWRNRFYQHLKTVLGVNFHRFIYLGYMLALMFFNGCAAWRIYTCGNFEDRARELCAYWALIGVMSTIPLVALRFYSVIWAFIYSVLSLGFSIWTLSEFASHDTLATIVLAFDLGTSIVFVLFFGYAVYRRADIYNNWEKKNGNGYMVLGDSPKQEPTQGHMGKGSSHHSHSHKQNKSKNDELDYQN